MEQQGTYVKLKAVRGEMEINLNTLLVIDSSAYCQYIYIFIYINEWKVSYFDPNFTEVCS